MWLLCERFRWGLHVACCFGVCSYAPLHPVFLFYQVQRRTCICACDLSHNTQHGTLVSGTIICLIQEKLVSGAVNNSQSTVSQSYDDDCVHVLLLWEELVSGHACKHVVYATISSVIYRNSKDNMLSLTIL